MGATSGGYATRATFLIALLVTALFIALGHDGRRIFQLLCLALPALLWLLWPIASMPLRRVRAVCVWLLTMSFVIDGIARAYLDDAYQAAPDSSMVLSAVANTGAQETREFLSMYWRRGAGWIVAMVGVAAVLAYALLRGGREPLAAWRVSARPGASGYRRAGLACIALVLAVSAVAYVSKPWRRLHPVLFWSNWTDSVAQMRVDWGRQEDVRQHALDWASKLHPRIAQPGPSTVVLVISESINRDNLGMYGYARATTPGMSEQLAKLDEHFVILRNAWSVDATTVPGIRNMMHFGSKESGVNPATSASPHLIALARAAGYKVWWIGNQDDVAIENLHVKLADEVRLVNRVPGRASASPDSAVLEPMRLAMDDPSPRKLVVIHLIGAHPHYRLRFPAQDHPFDRGADAVDAAMIAQGRPRWVRELRQDYDAALFHHDAVVSALLDMTREDGKEAGRDEGYRAWMYLSDHGQEVGHSINHAGHSQSTAAGYRIPALIWQSQPRQPLPADVDERPFRADWTESTLAGLLGLSWDGYQPEYDVLSPSYRWIAPALPANVTSFVR